MCTHTGYCREHGVDHRVWGDGPMTCERAQEIRARLTAHAPTAVESAEFWAGEPAVYDLERFVWHPGATNSPKASSHASAHTPEPHSKPKVIAKMFSPGWSVVLRCCGGRWPLVTADTWAAAMDTALEHVYQEHTPRFAGRRDGTSDADLEAAWHFHNLQQWHNRQEQAS